MSQSARKSWKEKKQARYRDKLESEGFSVKTFVVHADDYKELRSYADQLRRRRRERLAGKQ